ncbi:MAG: GNAT family N-acetyltransferase [Beijerinckiaceae bacterium]
MTAGRSSAQLPVMHENGYVKLPPGKIANAVTWLAIARPEPAGLPAPHGLTLRRLGPADGAAFRLLYRDIGRDWLWAGLLAKSEPEIAERLARPDVLSFAAEREGAPVGMLDMERTAGEGLEVVYFGFVPAFVGRGAGAWLMDEAKRIAARSGERLWLHTCNHDHPKALAFYRRQGFGVTAVGYEVMDDPRAQGLLPEDAAPHVPRVAG